MKKKGFGLISSCVGVLAVVLAFVSLAFNWITMTLGKTSEPMARGDWNKLLQAEISEVNMWKASRVFMIITLVVAAVVAVLLLVNLFYENKLLAQITKWVSLALIVLAAVYLIVFIVGCINYASLSGALDITVMPNAGPICLTLFSVVAGVFGMLSVKKAK